MLGLAILRRWRDLEVAATRLIILLYKKKKDRRTLFSKKGNLITFIQL